MHRNSLPPSHLPGKQAQKYSGSSGIVVAPVGSNTCKARNHFALHSAYSHGMEVVLVGVNLESATGCRFIVVRLGDGPVVFLGEWKLGFPGAVSTMGAGKAFAPKKLVMTPVTLFALARARISSSKHSEVPLAVWWASGTSSLRSVLLEEVPEHIAAHAVSLRRFGLQMSNDRTSPS